MTGEGIPKLYRSIEETPEFKAEAAAIDEADRLISEGNAKFGCWVGRHFIRPDGSIDYSMED